MRTMQAPRKERKIAARARRPRSTFGEPEGAMNREPDTQEPVLALLGDPATYLADAKNGGHAVKRIDTHAASVFLVGPRALKIKRAVKFPFLDFSTLEKRKAACEAELKVNRPFAPQIYRRVVAITREPDGALALDGGGQPVEWAIEMRRFDEALTLDHLAGQGRIDAALADTLGRVVAAGHAQATAGRAAALDRRDRGIYRGACRRIRQDARSLSARRGGSVGAREPRPL